MSYRLAPSSIIRHCLDSGSGHLESGLLELLDRGAALGQQDLQQLLADVGVEPAVDDRVGDGRGHGDHVTHGERDVKPLGRDLAESVWGIEDVCGQGEHTQGQPAHNEQDRHHRNHQRPSECQRPSAVYLSKHLEILSFILK